MLADVCGDAGFIIRIVVQLFKIVRVAVPIILIVMITIDLVKVVASPNADDKEKKEAFEKSIKRFLYAVLVFLLPTIINIILNKIEPLTSDSTTDTTSTSWVGCWQRYYNE